MASVLLFPTVATHRRLPHLPKEPKVSKEQETDIHQLSINNHHPIPTVDLSNKPLSLTQSTDQHQLTVPSDTAPSGGLKLIEQHGASTTPLTISTSSNDRYKGQIAAKTQSTAMAVETSPLGVPTGSKPAAIPHIDAVSNQGGHQECTVALQGHQLLTHPLNGPHGSSPCVTTAPSSSLPPLGAQPLSSLNESKHIKNALYDAFGCLYHPVQHTHHSSSSSSLSSVSTPHPCGGRLPVSSIVGLRSGEVTPHLGVSPGASPLLRPYMIASAPITPLELTSSVDGHMGGSYFGLHISSHSNSQNTSGTAPKGHHHLLNNNNTSRRGSGLHHEDAHHHHHHHYSYHSHSNSTLNESETPGAAAKSLSRKSSMDILNPIEHPVLCSLQTLSLTHPPKHYHPHLGHDLGHDRIPITPATYLGGDITSDSHKIGSAQTFEGQGLQQQSSIPNNTQSLNQCQQQQQQQQQLPLTPSELLSASTNRTNSKGSSSPFPMDSNDDSVTRFRQQELV